MPDSNGRPTVMDCQDEPEIEFNRIVVERRAGLPVGDPSSGGWSYDAATGLLRFDWEGISRVWKYTGETRIREEDGSEFMAFRWPD